MSAPTTHTGLVLAAMRARGRTSPSRIAEAAGLPLGSTNRALAALERWGMVSHPDRGVWVLVPPVVVVQPKPVPAAWQWSVCDRCWHAERVNSRRGWLCAGCLMLLPLASKVAA